ncbi:MAG: hypothetical protein WA949_13305 [Phormidesmis sp.]
MELLFWLAVAGLILFSWTRARMKGVPWFCFGSQPDQRRARHMAKRAQQIRLEENRRSRFPALDELTHNPDASARLVARLRSLNPDRSLDWCEEKAIYDIKRDRMAR